MRPVSQDFLDAVRGSHTMVADARVLTSFQTGIDPVGIDIPIVDGDVSYDASAVIRATLSLTTDGTRMWETGSDGLLTPYGNEIFVRRGIDFGNGVREWVSQGYYRITDAHQSSNVDNVIEITAYDRMANIVDSKFLQPRQFSAGLLLGTIVSNVVLEVYPDAIIEWDDDTDLASLQRTLVTEEDRYQFINDLVTSYGKIWYWDHRGILVIRDPPDPTVPVYNVNAGAYGVLITFDRSISREGACNAYIVTGEGTDEIPPVRVIATDDNPLSPTYWLGPFGQIPKFFSSQSITTVDQATLAAINLLKQSRGLPYNVDFDTVPNAALEPLDCVGFDTLDSQEIHVLETIRLPLTSQESQTATTREQLIVKLIEPDEVVG